MIIAITDLYKYAKLATTGYVDLTGAPDFATGTLKDASSAQQRMPDALGSAFFITDGWQVLGDPRLPPGVNGSHNDPNTGFAATLFEKKGVRYRLGLSSMLNPEVGIKRLA